MKFSERLNNYINLLGCTAKDLSNASGLSTATLSRYRSGKRIPDVDSEIFKKIYMAIIIIANSKMAEKLDKNAIKKEFLEFSDIIMINKEQFIQNLNTLISILNINISKLCHYINYDTSTIYRIRNGTRQPAELYKFACGVSKFISEQANFDNDKNIVAKLLNCDIKELRDDLNYESKVRKWLISNKENNNCICKFLNRLSEFNLNDYINKFNFNNIKVPSVPFQIPTSKTYFGLEEMMESELSFIKSTVLSKSMGKVIMYSDMPMQEMAKDKEFPRKWMFGMALMLKKGLYFKQIHNLDRPFEEMILGLEAWIPLYMTGQVSPYYLKNVQNNVFLHFLKVSGSAALVGEAIAGYHDEGKYYLTKKKEEVSYYKKRAEELLSKAYPLMDIYKEDRTDELKALLLSNSNISGNRRNILSSPPLYVVDEEYLRNILEFYRIDEEKIRKVLNFSRFHREIIEKILENNIINDEIQVLSKEEFEKEPVKVSFYGMFCNLDLPYTYEMYLNHIEQMEKFSNRNKNYLISKRDKSTFRNLNISIHEKNLVIVSKSKFPEIYFVIRHPKLRDSIETL